MDQVGSVEIVIKGGRPWGFTLQGGIESRSALTVSQIEPRGKADRHGVLKVGDHVLRINDVQCYSLADATQLIDCAFKTLTVLVWRSKSAVGASHPQSRDNRKCSISRLYRHLKDENSMVVKRTSATAGHKVLPRQAMKDSDNMEKQDVAVSQVTLTCDSHQESMDIQDAENLKKLWSSGDRSPLPSNVSLFLSSKSDSTLSLASTIDSQEDIFQTYESHSRYTRSPRNLTKDSGYETCAQTEHDYVNVEWINGSQVPNRTPLSSPLPPVTSSDYPKSNKSSSANKMSKPPVDYPTKYSSAENSCQEWRLERYEKSLVNKYHRGTEAILGQSYCSDCNESGIPSLPVPSKRRTGSVSSLCSSSESLSSRSSKIDTSHIRPAKSSLSLRVDSEKLKPVPSQQQDVVNSCQYFDKVVSSAQSTPDLLNSKRGMFPRRPNKKSVYEELACKSGFDFSPMVQRQPHRPPTKAIDRDGNRENRLAAPMPNSRNVEYQEPISLPTYCDKMRTSETNCSYNSQSETHRVVEPERYGSPGEASPPPIPTRDSSLRYRANTTHEKFPSWPASLPLQEELESVPQSSAYRSNSWTEQTQCLKEANQSYSRPETHFQISAEQLPPVQEKTKKSNRKSSDPSRSERVVDLAHSEYGSNNKSLPVDETFNLLTNHYAFDHVYQSSEDVFYPSGKKCSPHSPPERDVLSTLGNFANKQTKNYPCKDAYENVPRHVAESNSIYENLRVPAGNSTNHSNTPLLDRLRLERDNLPVSWSQQDVDAFSDTGTCVGSDSSSQETLKWHGSCSDLASMDEHSRNKSPSYGSDTSTIYEELMPGSLDGSEKSYSTFCSSASNYRIEKYPQKENEWERFSSIPYHPVPAINHEHSISSTSVMMETKDFDLNTRRKNAQCDMAPERNNTMNSSSQPLPVHLSKYSKLNSSMLRLNEGVPSSCSSKTKESGTVHSPSDSEANSSKDPMRAMLEAKQNISYTSPSHSQSSSSCWRDPSRRNSSYSKELKAIQKEAVMSFYLRQTGVASKDDSVERKAPRSLSFSHSRGISAMDKPVPPTVKPRSQNQWKRSLSSNSFSQQVSEPRSPVGNSSAQNSISPNEETQARAPSISSHDPIVRSRKPEPIVLPVESGKVTVLSDEEKSDNESTASHQVNDFTQETNPDSDISQSDRSLKPSITVRKAYLKKSGNTNENIVMKVFSSQGITLAKNKDHIKHSPGYPGIKPKVPPKKLPKQGLVMPIKHQASPIPPALLMNQECITAEDEELQEIESVATKSCISSPVSTVGAPSPELPLPPPPPTSFESEIYSTDDPFPPPPDFKEFTFDLSENNQMNFHTFYSKKNCNSLHDLRISFPCDVPETCISVSNIGAQHNEQLIKDTSPGWTDRVASPKESSPVFSRLHISNKEDQGLEKMEVQSESEALYVNLDFRNRNKRQNFKNFIPSPNAQSSVSVTNSATQTSEATPSLQRKTVQSVEEECFAENLPRCAIHPSEYINQSQSSHQNQSRNEISFQGLIENGLRVASYSTVQANETVPARDVIGLPSTNPYFTTSEPKAKLLTRYCQFWDKQLPDHLELKGQKEELIASISTKLNILRLEQIDLKEEMKQNEELGKEVTSKIEKIAKPNEVQKYRIHVEELEKIINLLLSLSGRLARAENALLILPEEAKDEEKSMLEAKRNKLSQQHDEAWYLKENIDRRSSQVSLFLHHYLSKEEYADYEHFIKMKSKLLMDAKEIDEKIRLGEEQLAALHGTFQVNHQNGEKDIKICGELKESVKR